VHNKTKLEVICKNFGISEREQDVLSLVIIGTSQKDIADKLSISVNTVKSHLQNIYKKIGVSGRLQLIFKINSIN
jgi:DNA-binding CsgD family transcriptional regulator